MNPQEFVLTVISSGAVSAALAGLLLWVTKTWLSERLRSSIKNEYDIKFEAYKDELKRASDQDIEAFKARQIREGERHKTTLKNSEIIFSRQLEALANLRVIFRQILPKRKGPDDDWSDAIEGIALFLSDHADKLDEFLGKYAAVIPSSVVQKLDTASAMATDGSFQIEWDNTESMPEPTMQAREAAEKLYKTVKEAVNDLQIHVNSQIDSGT